MASIEGLVRSIVTAPSASSHSDFVDRIVRGGNVSLRQYAKSTICRVIQNEVTVVNLDSANALLSELSRVFPGDAVVSDCLQKLRDEKSRRSVLKPVLIRNVSPVRASPLSARVKDPPFIDHRADVHRADIFHRLKAKSVASSPAMSHRFDSTPRLSSRTIPVRNLFNDLTSSSDESMRVEVKRTAQPQRALSDVDLSSLKRLKRKSFWNRWRAVADRNGAIQIIAQLLVRRGVRFFFSRLQQLRVTSKRRSAALEESIVLTALKSDIALKEKFYDAWRRRFVHIMETRRLQVSGIKAMVQVIDRQMISKYRFGWTRIRDHMRVEQKEESMILGLKILKKIMRKKISQKLSLFAANVKVNGVVAELRRVKTKQALDTMASACTAAARREKRWSLSKLQIQSLSRRIRDAQRSVSLQAWLRVANRAESRRSAFLKADRVVRKFALKQSFLRLKRLGVENRLLNRRVQAIVGLIGRQSVKPAFSALKSHAGKGAVMERLLGVVEERMVKWGFRRLVEFSATRRVSTTRKVLEMPRLAAKASLREPFRELQKHATNMKISYVLLEAQAVESQLRLELDSVRDGLNRGDHLRSSLQAELHAALSDRREVENRSILAKALSRWKLWIKQRRSLGRLFRSVESAENRFCLAFFITAKREVVLTVKRDSACMRLSGVLARSVASVTSEAMEQWRKVAIKHHQLVVKISHKTDTAVLRNSLFVWRELRLKLRRLTRIAVQCRLGSLREAFAALKQRSWQQELLEALHQSDDWRNYAAYKSIITAKTVDRLSEANNEATARLTLVTWFQYSKSKRDKLKRLVALMDRRVKLVGFREFSDRISLKRPDRITAGLVRLTAMTDKWEMRNVMWAVVKLKSNQFERTVVMLERVARTEMIEQENAMRDMEAAAKELESDFTAVLARTRVLENLNEELSNEMVISASRFENEARENELLLLKLNEFKSADSDQKRHIDRLREENERLHARQTEFDSVQELVSDQRDQIAALQSKLNEFAKLSASLQFYKNKISLQGEQIVSLQDKLRHSAASPEDVLFSSPINARSEDLTYASSSLRGLQQAVDRSSSLRIHRRTSAADRSVISGDSTRRRREFRR